MPWDHVNYFEGLEVFVNNPRDSLIKLVFHCLDNNADGYISNVDLFVLMKTLDGDIFVDVASRDVVDLVRFLEGKLKEKGLDDPILNEKRRLEKEFLQRKNLKYRQLLGVEVPDDDYQSESIFKLSALEKMGNIVENHSLHEVNSAKIQKNPKSEDTPGEASEPKKPRKFGVKDISYEICESDETTMKCSLEEYLKFITTGKLPDLLIDIFTYLGAKKYVKHVIKGGKKKNLNTIDSEGTSTVDKRGRIKQQSTIKIDRELDKWREQLGEETVDNFIKAFTKLSIDKKKPENELTISLESVI